MNLEEKTLQSIELSEHQKMVLCKTKAAPTPKVAGEDISDGDNMIHARDVMIDLELIDFTENGEATVTPKGDQIMQDEGLADDMGELTETGQKYVQKEVAEQFSLLKDTKDLAKLLG